jgi:undecaprenyl diphosphate synthase
MSEPVSELPKEALPGHVAIIMDGNGRWARRQGLKRVRGHRIGSETVRKVTTECARLGLERLTLYAFSSENWKRPKLEVDFLMRLLKEFVIKERTTLMENNISLRAIGQLHRLPEAVRQELDKTIEMSAKNTGLVMTLALSYGGRAEIADAARRIAEEIREGTLTPEMVTEDTVAERLYDPEMTDPDLLIRTGGELRVSNYLLWQIAYSEFWVTDVCWPDFSVEQLHSALAEFVRRERRFGGLKDEQ